MNSVSIGEDDEGRTCTYLWIIDSYEKRREKGTTVADGMEGLVIRSCEGFDLPRFLEAPNN